MTAPELLAQLRNAIARGDDATAASLAGAVLADAPAHEATLVWLAARARHRDAFDEAQAWARRGLAVRPESAALRFQLGAAQAAPGELSAADVTLLVEISVGWRNLCRIVTRAHKYDREKHEPPPAVPLETLEEYSAGAPFPQRHIALALDHGAAAHRASLAWVRRALAELSGPAAPDPPRG